MSAVRSSDVRADAGGGERGRVGGVARGGVAALAGRRAAAGAGGDARPPARRARHPGALVPAAREAQRPH